MNYNVQNEVSRGEVEGEMVMLSGYSSVKGSPGDKQPFCPSIRESAKKSLAGHSGTLHQCSILACTIFHYPAHTDVNPCPIAVHPSDCALHAKRCTTRARGAYKSVFHLRTPVMCTGKWIRIKMLHRYHCAKCAATT